MVIVGSGGVGKTTLAAALGLESARRGQRTLVMTFDPSLRLKDALGVGEEARHRPVRVPGRRPGGLEVALLDARSTFDRLIERYAPDTEAAERIFRNRFYRDLAGGLAGILEYMAVERLFEVAAETRYQRIILDTPPTTQALDFLEAPERIVSFLDSGAVKLALSPWFQRKPGLRGMPLRVATRGAENLLDRIVGLRLLEDLIEFFQAFAPLFDGFRERALEVQRLLRHPDTVFALVTGAGEERIPDTMFFARKLRETGHHLGPIIVNPTHPTFPPLSPAAAADPGAALLAWLGERDQRGLVRLRQLLSRGEPLLAVPLRPEPPTTLETLSALGRELGNQLKD